MPELTGWLFDLYPHPQDSLVLWLLEDGNDRTTPHRLTQAFPVTFYAAGSDAILRQAWQWLRSQDARLERTEGRDLFLQQPRVVMAVTVANPYAQPRLFARLSQAFPALEYFDADLPVALRHAAQYGTFPLGRVCVAVDKQQAVQSITPLDSPWEIDPCLPRLRCLRIEPDCDPAHAEPRYIAFWQGLLLCLRPFGFHDVYQAFPFVNHTANPSSDALRHFGRCSCLGQQVLSHCFAQDSY